VSVPTLSNKLSTLPPLSNTPPASPPRIVSVDALRGFDMFWIVGGGKAADALDQLQAGPAVSMLAGQMKHAEWVGFHFFDLIFPLFLFLIGVSIVLSMGRALAKSGRKATFIRVARRSALLFVIGVILSEGLSRPWPDVHLSGVLHRIAFCYLIAATLTMLLPRKGIAVAATACLAGYWAMLMFIPFPDVDLKHPPHTKNSSQAQAKSAEELLKGVSAMTRGTFDEGRNLCNYVDFRALPGWKRNLYYTNEGLLSTIPSVAITLFGMMAGWVLVSQRLSERQKVWWLIGGGAAGVALGLLWGLQFPIIKRIWTSSFCLLASGCSAMLLGIFYLVVDVWRWQKWCTPFLWIGTNAITIYIATNLVDFGPIAARFVGGDVKAFLDTHVTMGSGTLVIAIVGLALPVLLVRFLYEQKIFIRL
jgi:predicted acyltransferase